MNPRKPYQRTDELGLDALAHIRDDTLEGLVQKLLHIEARTIRNEPLHSSSFFLILAVDIRFSGLAASDGPMLFDCHVCGTDLRALLFELLVLLEPFQPCTNPESDVGMQIIHRSTRMMSKQSHNPPGHAPSCLLNRVHIPELLCHIICAIHQCYHFVRRTSGLLRVMPFQISYGSLAAA